MILVCLPDRIQRRLPFYLTMEEWVAKRLPAGDYFFCWQVAPTVIFGRNQSIDTEVDLDYCKANSIEVYRRKSGGGCVFADMNNLMFSYITPSAEVVTTFSRYTGMVAEMLQSLGIDAEATGRNDITIGGRKVSGNSFYHMAGRSIVHGTMLYDTDMTHICNAITPSKSKLESKQVKSVASHITTLNCHTGLTLNEFKKYAIDRLTDSKIMLSQEQVDEIERMSLPYYDPEWIYGRHNPAAMKLRRRIDGIGEFVVGMDIKHGRVADINIEGDFFLVGDIDNALLDRIKGVRYTKDDLESALSDVDVSQIISGLSNDKFIELIIQ